MGYDKKGYNLNSLANLSKGAQLPKLTYTDTRSQELAAIILDEEVEYNDVTMTNREAVLRQQLAQAISGDLRSCQFLIELAGGNNPGETTIETAAVSPLEQLQAMMQRSRIDDRRRTKGH